jgi:hypothetical protein
MTMTDARSSMPGISPAELTAMQDAAAAFRQAFAGGRTEYIYSGPGQGTPNHAHFFHRGDRFAVLARPAA